MSEQMIDAILSQLEAIRGDIARVYEALDEIKGRLYRHEADVEVLRDRLGECRRREDREMADLSRRVEITATAGTRQTDKARAAIDLVLKIVALGGILAGGVLALVRVSYNPIFGLVESQFLVWSH